MAGQLRRRARARTCAGGRGSGAVSSRTPRRPPSRTSRSRLRTARNICAGTGWSGSHSIIHRRLEQFTITAGFSFYIVLPSSESNAKIDDESTVRSSWNDTVMQDVAQEERPRRKGKERSEVNWQARKTLFTAEIHVHTQITRPKYEKNYITPHLVAP